MNEQMTNSPNNFEEEDTIDYVVALIKNIWIDRKLIFKITVSFFIIGIITSLLSPEIYTSNTTFVPQVSDNGIASRDNSLGSLASLAGININASSTNSDSYLSPLLYKKITGSEEFSLNLVEKELFKLNGDKITIKEYMYLSSKSNFNFDPVGFIKKYTIGLFLNNNNNNNGKNNEGTINYTFINSEDYNNIIAFRNKFRVELNQVDGYINVSAYDKDPFVSAQLVRLITTDLQSKIIEIRTNKVKEQLEYSKKQYELKQNEFDLLQKKLAEFKDSNKNISTASFMSELQKLDTEYNLQRSILINLASEYNSNKIKLNQDTPIFSVIDDVTVPYERSHPKRASMVLIYTLIGLIISILFTLFKDSIKEILSKFKE